jgi:hypothetical protein
MGAGRCSALAVSVDGKLASSASFWIGASVGKMASWGRNKEAEEIETNRYALWYALYQWQAGK